MLKRSPLLLLRPVLAAHGVAIDRGSVRNTIEEDGLLMELNQRSRCGSCSSQPHSRSALQEFLTFQYGLRARVSQLSTCTQRYSKVSVWCFAASSHEEEEQQRGEAHEKSLVLGRESCSGQFLPCQRRPKDAANIATQRLGMNLQTCCSPLGWCLLPRTLLLFAPSSAQFPRITGGSELSMEGSMATHLGNVSIKSLPTQQTFFPENCKK